MRILIALLVGLVFIGSIQAVVEYNKHNFWSKEHERAVKLEGYLIIILLALFQILFAIHQY